MDLFLQAAVKAVVGDLSCSVWIGNRAAPSVYGLAAFRPGSAIGVGVQLFHYLIHIFSLMSMKKSCKVGECRIMLT